MSVKLLENEAREALGEAKAIREDPDATEAQFKTAWAAYETKHAAWQDAAKIESAERSLSAPKLGEDIDLREVESDPTRVEAVSKDEANKNPSGFKDLGNGMIVPYATRDSEGYLRKYPAAVQRPDIIARYGPELQTEAELQREAFAAYMRKGYQSVAVKSPDKLKFLDALQEDTDTEGGYLVPTDQRTELIHDPGAPGSSLRRISRVLQTVRDGGTFPTGTTAAWAAIAEEADPGITDPVFGQVTFTIRKSGINFKLSEEFLADEASDVLGFIGNVVDEESGRYEDQQGIEGDGTTEPLGLRTTAAHGTVGDITDLLTLAAPTLTEVVSAWAEVPAQFRTQGQGFAWHMTSSLFARIASISASGGQLWTLPNAANAPRPLILGAPVEFFDGTGWDDAATISANEEVGAVGGFMNYVFMDRVGVTVRRDDSRFADTDQILIRARKRYDSFFTISNAFRILKGAAA